MKLQWIEDPAHGWLKVKTKDLLKIMASDIVHISSYSYLGPLGEFSYLEEDSDATKFIDTLGREKFIGMKVKTVYQDPTPIRDYPRFDAVWVFNYISK